MSCELYPTLAGAVSPEVRENMRVSLIEQQKLPEIQMNALQPVYNYLLDVPVSDLDAEVLGTSLRETEPPQEPLAGMGFLTADAALALGEEERAAHVHRLAPFPLFDPSQVKHLPTTKAIKIRREWLPHRQQFPIYQQRTAFFDAVVSNAVVLLVGGRGTGKTLQVPSILAESDRMKRSRIVVVAANVHAAALTARRLRLERGEEAAGVAASAIGCVLPCSSDAHAGSSTIVTTAEVLLRQLLCDPTLVRCGGLVFDDAHARDEATEQCFAAVKALLGRQSGAGGRRLHVVVNCLDEAVANPIRDFFASAKTGTIASAAAASAAPCQVGLFSIGSRASSSSSSAAAVLYVEETVQWLRRCVKEGPFVCADADADLRAYTDDVDVVARAMAADDNRFVDGEKGVAYYTALVTEAVMHFHSADAAAAAAAAAADSEDVSEPLSAIVIIAPDAHAVDVVGARVFAALAPRAENEEAAEGNPQNNTNHDDDDGADGEEEESGYFAQLDRQGFAKAGSDYAIVPLTASTPTDFLLRVASRTLLGAGERGRRCVLIASAGLSETVLPFSLDVGLVVDLALQSRLSLDVESSTDKWQTEYAPLQALRHRQTIAHRSSGSEQQQQQPCMVVQLISCRTLHSTAHRQFSADPTQHAVFHLPLSRYLALYRAYKMWDKAYYDCSGGAAQEENEEAAGAGSSVNVFLTSMPALIAGSMIGVPAPTAARYGQLTRILTAVEVYLVASGELDADDDNTASLTPLGVYAALLPLPMQVSRALLFAPIFDSVVEATAVAATWLVADFFASVGRGALNASASQRREQGELRDEAVDFFSQKTANDAAAAFAVYRMWLVMRQEGAEVEHEFLQSCCVPGSVLRRTLATQCELVRYMKRLGLATAPLPRDDVEGGVSEAAVASAVRGAAEGAGASGKVQACLTAALYPNCGVQQSDGLSLLLDGFHNVTPDAPRRLTTMLHRRFAAFVASSAATAAPPPPEGDPFLYLAKTVSAEQLATLSHAVPVFKPAAIVHCGEAHQRVQAPPTRCRGFYSPLTSAWRETRAARSLPPPAQLPTPAIATQAYDTIPHRTVIVYTDYNWSCTLRSTTLGWLQKLRAHTKKHIRGFVEDRAWDSAASSVELARAWQWWMRRQETGKEWLREERSIARSNAAATASSSSAVSPFAVKLYPFYHFQLGPGRPQTVVVPHASELEQQRLQQEAAASAAAAAASASGRPGEALLNDDADVFKGRRPGPDVEEILLQCVEIMAAQHSRATEAKLLKEAPENFAFLDPENQFHEYYLYMLRRRAPDIRFLGQDLEELQQFLVELEDEVRAVCGLPPQGGDAYSGGGGPNYHSGNADSNNIINNAEAGAEQAEYQLQEVENAEDAAGLQLDTDAVNLAPQKFTPGAVVQSGLEKTVDVEMLQLQLEQQKQQQQQQQQQTGSASPADDATTVTTTTGTDTVHNNNNVAATNGGPQNAAADAEKASAYTYGYDNNNNGNPVFGGVDQQQQQQQPPTQEELMALLGAVPLMPPADPLLPQSMMSLNPLARPPPPIPPEAVEARKSSVLVYPLPKKVKNVNLQLALAKALGEKLELRVGPTRLVGKVGRIDVPNANVEARALEEVKSFMCLGQRVNVIRNDRIIDNPNARRGRGGGGGWAGRGRGRAGGYGYGYGAEGGDYPEPHAQHGYEGANYYAHNNQEDGYHGHNDDPSNSYYQNDNSGMNDANNSYYGSTANYYGNSIPDSMSNQASWNGNRVAEPAEEEGYEGADPSALDYVQPVAYPPRQKQQDEAQPQQEQTHPPQPQQQQQQQQQKQQRNARTKPWGTGVPPVPLGVFVESEDDDSKSADSYFDSSSSSSSSSSKASA